MTGPSVIFAVASGGEKTQASIDPSFDRTTILFHYVVQVGNDSAVTPSTQSTLLFQFVDDGRI